MVMKKELAPQYGKSAAQVALRWLIERWIVAIPKSMHKTRMAENFNVFDFALLEADMQAIAPVTSAQAYDEHTLSIY